MEVLISSHEVVGFFVVPGICKHYW